MTREEAIVALKNLAKIAPPTNFMMRAVQVAISALSRPDDLTAAYMCGFEKGKDSKPTMSESDIEDIKWVILRVELEKSEVSGIHIIPKPDLINSYVSIKPSVAEKIAHAIVSHFSLPQTKQGKEICPHVKVIEIKCEKCGKSTSLASLEDGKETI